MAVLGWQQMKVSVGVFDSGVGGLSVLREIRRALPEQDVIYVADSRANAIQVVSLDGKVRTLAQNGDTDGTDGGMDQPCEPLLRGREVIVSNMDWPVAGCINKKYDKPCTLSVIKLDR